MRKLTKRFALAAASASVAGGAVLGAGGTASAATPASEHVQRSAVNIKTDGHRWHRDVSYRHDHEYKCCPDDYRGRQPNDSDRYTNWDRYDHHWNRYDRNWYRNDHGSYRYDGGSNRYDHDGNRNR
ncbi:hypothetical protein AB0478_46575 [Streptomyces sp. NPDC051917]|uniref:hypothetical protein n=1 Tax=Streptomyces sp. NPDC051917 TaxID=3154754 RepID=UPI003454AE67